MGIVAFMDVYTSMATKTLLLLLSNLRGLGTKKFKQVKMDHDFLLSVIHVT